MLEWLLRVLEGRTLLRSGLRKNLIGLASGLRLEGILARASLRQLDRYQIEDACDRDEAKNQKAQPVRHQTALSVAVLPGVQSASLAVAEA